MVIEVAVQQVMRTCWELRGYSIPFTCSDSHHPHFLTRLFPGCIKLQFFKCMKLFVCFTSSYPDDIQGVILDARQCALQQ